MKIVVTGALGHIGSRLIRAIPDRFPDAGIEMVDNLSTQRYCSLFNLPENGRYHFIEADILTANLDAVFAGADVVVHLAAITNAEGSFKVHEKVEQTNFVGTERVAHACIRTGSPLIFLSSTSVYGTQADLVDESCAASELKPQSPYADSKLRSERLLQLLGQEQGLKFVVFRFGTIFGSSIGMRFHTAVNKFIWQACTGIPLTVWRSALDQKRPYLDLEDAIRTLLFTIDSQLYDREVYNVLTLNATVREVVATLSEFVPDLQVSLVDHQIMNQLSYEVSCRKFAGLGFRFTGDLRQRIDESVSLFKGVRTWQNS